MAFSDLCHISNAYKAVENETDQSERIMEENSMVRDLITKILDETGPAESSSSLPPSEKTLNASTNAQYPKNEPSTSFIPPYYQEPYFNQNHNEQNGFNFNPQNGFGNGFLNYPEDQLLMEPMGDSEVTQEQLYLLKLAAQEIGGAQFASPNKYEYNFFEPNQRNSLPETNMFNSNFNRPNSLNLDGNFNYDSSQRYPNKFENNQDPAELLAYLNQLNISLDRQEMPMDYKMPENHYQNDDFKLQDERNKMLFNRNFQQPPKFNGDNAYFNEMMKQMGERPPPNFDFQNAPPNFKPNGYQNDWQRSQMPRENFQGNLEQRGNFEGQNAQQAILRQQELARQMSLLMRNRPPPNQLNVDVSFLHENTPFNLGLGALLGPSPPCPPPVLPSPMMDLPLLAPFYAMRNIRGAATSSGILHARLDACYEQWRQLERERKRTEARLALAYPGRAVSSSNSIPVPRLPPCPTRVDRLTVDMLREHTKVLTLMGKMETLRASVCVANKKANKEDPKITLLRRGDPDRAPDAAFEPSSWRDDIGARQEIAPHSEVESAMLSWRSAVAAVQAARRRELAQPRYGRPDPILQLAEAVKQLGACARRARCAMWCDLTLTVALAPRDTPNEKPQPQAASPKTTETTENPQTSKPTVEAKEEKPADTKAEAKQEPNNNKTTATNKQTEKDKSRRTQNYRHKVNGRDFYPKNQRYDHRFMQNRHPYYLATGPIN